MSDLEDAAAKISPLAGQPATAAMLVDVPRLVSAYYTEIPDPSLPAQRVAFGTAGHRGSAFRVTFNEWLVLVRAPDNDAPIGGLKVTAADGWFAVRPSGTEDLYKIYAESFRSADHLRRILEEAQATVDAALVVPECSGQ